MQSALARGGERRPDCPIRIWARTRSLTSTHHVRLALQVPAEERKHVAFRDYPNHLRLMFYLRALQLSERGV